MTSASDTLVLMCIFGLSLNARAFLFPGDDEDVTAVTAGTTVTASTTTGTARVWKEVFGTIPCSTAYAWL